MSQHEQPSQNPVPSSSPDELQKPPQVLTLREQFATWLWDLDSQFFATFLRDGEHLELRQCVIDLQRSLTSLPGEIDGLRMNLEGRSWIESSVRSPEEPIGTDKALLTFSRNFLSVEYLSPDSPWPLLESIKEQLDLDAKHSEVDRGLEIQREYRSYLESLGKERELLDAMILQEAEVRDEISQLSGPEFLKRVAEMKYRAIMETFGDLDSYYYFRVESLEKYLAFEETVDSILSEGTLAVSSALQIRQSPEWQRLGGLLRGALEDWVGTELGLLLELTGQG